MYKNFLKTVIISDALSAPFDTLSGGHIKTHFKNITSYIDAEPALKGNMQKWKKPSMYTYVSQLMIITAIMAQNRNFSPEKFLHIITNSPDIENYNFKFLRNPEYLYKIASSDPDYFSSNEHNNIKSSFLPFFCAVMSFFTPGNSAPIKDIFHYCRYFTENIETIAYCVFTSYAFYLLKTNSLPDAITGACSSTVDFFKSNQPFIFESKLNPDKLIKESESVEKLMRLIITKPDDGEKIIINYYNALSKNQITRATIDDIRTIIPFAICLTLNDKNVSAKTITESIFHGGCTHALAVYVSAFASLSSEKDIFSSESSLNNDLTNKRKISDLISLISNEKCAINIISEFINDEIPLTRKALEEANAKFKKIKNSASKKTHKKETREEKLSKHVVESWTKIDKARYKKEKSRNITSDGDEYEDS